MSRLYVHIYPNGYRDSIQLLLATSVMMEQTGITSANFAMGTEGGKCIFKALGMESKTIDDAKTSDLIAAAFCDSEEVFEAALSQAFAALTQKQAKGGGVHQAYRSLETARREHPEAQVCMISIPGEYAKAEAMRALNAGMHVILFSSHISPQDERELKETAREKGLLCMGPDCGVVNLDGAAFLLASITNRGPFGLCGATGVGIQHVGALLHAAGSGVSQIIGTGGGDLRQPVGGISMMMGIDALEADPQTKYILLVSRKPGQETLQTVLQRVEQCKKPVVIYFMGCDAAPIEAAGAIYANNLDDVAVQALRLIGEELALQTDEEITALAEKAAQGMAPQQKYVRGLFTGGTYCDEAMRTMRERIGPIYSNCPLTPDMMLKESTKSRENTCVDYGEDEFTLGKPHPTMEPSIRCPHILREAEDPTTAVLLLDFIFAAAAHPDPVGVVLQKIKEAMALAQSRGGKLAVVASVCGTDADFQNLAQEKQMLSEAGVYVCDTNYRAALLAGKIVELLSEEVKR
ncbi:hypothetical protein [Beduinella massiliensis]|uniref:hypothetical protein n=1 Tax=Beduinella massiliensis TaxID=1852363 RepID=UPI000C81D6C7